MTKSGTLSIGYFEEFKFGDPTILIWGDKSGLTMFSERLRKLSAASNKSIVLNDIPIVRTVHDAKIRLEIVKHRSGMIRSEASPEANFLWSLSPSQASDFADLVTEITKADHACHQYLETENEAEIVVVVSKDEYPDDFG